MNRYFGWHFNCVTAHSPQIVYIRLKAFEDTVNTPDAALSSKSFEIFDTMMRANEIYFGIFLMKKVSGAST